MLSTLGQFQQTFAEALLVPAVGHLPASGTLTAQPAFSVYRNTVMKAYIDALEANFPAVARLVGRDWFRAAAAIYARQTPPSDARLLHYGDSFVDFLRNFGPAESLIYLPGVATLDIFWRESHVAADAHCTDADWVASLAPEQLASLVLKPHPAARWFWFDQQPIYSIWSRNRHRSHDGEPSDEQQDLNWQAEGALLTRPGDTVAWQIISQAGCKLLDACASGLPLVQAANLASMTDPETDMANLFATLLRAGAFAGTSTPTHLFKGTP